MSTSSTTDPAKPWENEPNTLCWEWEERLMCRIARNSLGVLCGYVFVPQAHPLHRKGTDSWWCVEVHGGVTFANLMCFPGTSMKRYAIGFDCNHLGDLVPLLPYSQGKYRTFGMVKAETEKLAAQVWDGLAPTAKLAVWSASKESKNNG